MGGRLQHSVGSDLNVHGQQDLGHIIRVHLPYSGEVHDGRHDKAYDSQDAGLSRCLCLPSLPPSLIR